MDPPAQVPGVPGRTAGLSVPGTDYVLSCVHTAAARTPAVAAHADIVTAAGDGTADGESFDAEDVFVVIVAAVIHTAEVAAAEVVAVEVVAVEAVVAEAVAVEYVVVVAAAEWLLAAYSVYVTEEDSPAGSTGAGVHTSESPAPRHL